MEKLCNGKKKGRAISTLGMNLNQEKKKEYFTRGETKEKTRYSGKRATKAKPKKGVQQKQHRANTLQGKKSHNENAP